MLGRLARYLRFVGCDTVYVRGLSDDELLAIARRDGRVVLTRDRELARRASPSLLVASPLLADQWRAVRAAWPSVPASPTFDRCTVCNGPLEPRRARTLAGREAEIPPPLARADGTVYACRDCGHLYWEGSHTAKVRATLQAWERGGGA